MTTVGLIGSGKIGSTVARLAIAAGHRVVLSNSRGPQTLTDLVAELGPRARAATTRQAAMASDIVVVSVPVKAYRHLPADALAGRIVIDTGNYYPERDGHVPELEGTSLTDSEFLLSCVPAAKVVKGFNNIFFKHLRNLSRPAGAPDRSYLPIAGDDAVAKASVTEFNNSIGYGTMDAGPLAEGWRQQPGTPAYVAPYGAFENDKGVPVSAGALRAALGEATEADRFRPRIMPGDPKTRAALRLESR